jgi:cation diffusion facilitator CzcD-associated flavoprotein CzcO
MVKQPLIPADDASLKSCHRHITVENLQNGQTIVDKADVVISARGTLNEMAWPDIQGFHEMKIPVMHSAAWDLRCPIYP